MTVERVERTAVGVAIWADSKAREAACPGCGLRSSKVHSRYDRKLADGAVAGQPVVLRLQVRRYFCDNQDCPVRTFAEQIEGVTSKHARRTGLARRMLEQVGLALAGRAGSRLAGALGVPTGRHTLLRLIDALPVPPVGTVAVLGVDDFALRRGHVYGTVLINIESSRPVDVLSDRTAESLAAWLSEHPGTQIVCRDRATAYAEAVRTAAPEAIQVADRFHLWQNLAQAVEKCVVAHRGCLAEPVAEQAEQPTVTPPVQAVDTGPLTTGKRAENTRQRHAAVHELYDKGVGITAVSRLLGMDHKTVLRYARAATAEELLAPPRSHYGPLRRYQAYLNQRWNEGCTDSSRLFTEIQAMGYRGSSRTVRRWLEPLRASPAPAPTITEAPSIRQVTGWLTRHPDNVNDDEKRQLTRILDRCPELAAVAERVRDFGTMMTTLDGHRLGEWIDTTVALTMPPLQAFARNLRKDFDAVTAGLTLPWSSGRVEGHVNRVKMLKRQMFGRASFSLLRKRILCTT